MMKLIHSVFGNVCVHVRSMLKQREKACLLAGKALAGENSGGGAGLGCWRRSHQASAKSCLFALAHLSRRRGAAGCGWLSESVNISSLISSAGVTAPEMINGWPVGITELCVIAMSDINVGGWPLNEMPAGYIGVETMAGCGDLAQWPVSQCESRRRRMAAAHGLVISQPAISSES
jgi:hypothetical protein